jgi:outer membrane translocation and assembly module TamA
VLAEILCGIGRNWYVGPRYLFGDLRTSVQTDDLLPPALDLPPFELDSQIAAFGLRLQHDSRDTLFYPTRGTLADVEINSFDAAWGSDFTFQSYALSYNKLIGITEAQVLVVRGYAHATSSHAPFFALSSFGSRADLRGYTAGRYRDRVMFAVQAEYRWRLTSRIGLVAFGGFGSVAPDLNEFDTLLPGIGLGVRYVLAKKNHVSMRFDVA